MDRFKEIYMHHASEYERLVSFEEYQENLPGAVGELIDLQDAAVLELGAGTGRLTQLLAPEHAKLLLSIFPVPCSGWPKASSPILRILTVFWSARTICVCHFLMEYSTPP